MRSMVELKTSSVNKQQLSSSVDYLHLPYLPFDLVEQILCRLPVKTLLRIRCVCKSLNSLTSDPKFAKKHLSMSTTHHLHFLSYSRTLSYYITFSCSLHDVFTTVPTNITNCLFDRIVGSCNGILCLVCEDPDKSLVRLWNHSIRKYKELPPLFYRYSRLTTFGFGYDFVTDIYKVVAVLHYSVLDDQGYFVENKTEVKVYTLGTNSWKNIQTFPFESTPSESAGRFVSGTINWLASKDWNPSPIFIVSLDLGKESYKKVLLPDCGVVDWSILYLSVLRDCLCMIYGHDIWIMKEYGNNESWTKLFSVPYKRYCMKSCRLTKAVYMFEDDQVLLASVKHTYSKLNVYDPRSGALKFIKFQNKDAYNSLSYDDGLEVCIESLISPCF